MYRAYTRTDDESVRPLPLAKWYPLLLFQREHDNGQSEHVGLARARESNANHVPPTKTKNKNKL